VRKVFSIPLARAGIIIGLGFAAIIGTFDAIAARFLKDLGGTDGELIIVMIALFVPLVVAMPFAGKLVDHHGPARCGTIALIVAAPLVFSFGLSRDLVFIGIVGGLVALAYSVVYTAGQAAVAGGTVPVGLSGAGQGAYEATYAIGSMICAFLAPRLYDRSDAMVLWATVATASVVAAGLTWWTAGSSRREQVHMAELEEEMYKP
jgi:predicted MFS family arabinose efflux permease